MGREKTNKQGILNEQPGVLSMRRFLALVFSILAVVISILLVIFNSSTTWQSILALVGVPIVAVLFLMTCTTITDAVDVINAVKGNGKKKQYLDSEPTLESKPDPDEL